MDFRHLSLVLVLLAACAPSQHDQVAYGVVRVAISTEWRDPQAGYAAAAVADLSALGPTFVVVTDAPDVTVTPFEVLDCDRDGAGRYTRGATVVAIDPVCTPGELAFRTAVGHELMHWLTWTRWRWAGHICRHDGEAPDCHPTIFGTAMLNPALTYGDATIGYDEAFVGDVPTWQPQQPDLDLVRTLAGR